MKTLNAKQVEDKFSSNDNAIIIDVLPKESFDKGHIPGAINIPLESKDFAALVAKKATSKAQDILVYCASAQCTASEDAAKKLAAAGYTAIHRFTGGLKEWKDSSHKVEGTMEKSGKESKVKSGGCC